MKIFYFLSACLFSFAVQAQNILIVDNNPGINATPAHVYPDFASAIADAANGDVIYMQPSAVSYGAVTISKGVTVYGTGHTPELDNGLSVKFDDVTISANNVKLSGVYITNNVTNSGTRSNSTIENCRITTISLDSGINGCLIQGNLILRGVTLNANAINAVNVTLRNNFCYTAFFYNFKNFNSTTIFTNNLVTTDNNSYDNVFNNANGLVVQNSIFVYNNIQNWVGNTGGTPITFNNCLTYNLNPANVFEPLTGSNNRNNVNPQFVAIPNNSFAFNVANDYNVSPTLLGTDGLPIGLFNGGYDFDMRGYPTPLAYIREMNINNSVITAGATLNVTLKANANKTN
jgi:hypothetical protein